MKPIPVRAHSIIGFGTLALGVAALLPALLLGDLVLGGAALLLGLLSWSWFATPLFSVYPDRIERYGRLGGVRQQVFFGGLHRLELRGRQLYLSGERIPIADATAARPQDWRRLERALAEAA
jgi:hypothetical protein